MMLLIDAIAAVENGPAIHENSRSPWNIQKRFWQDVKRKFPNADIGQKWEDIQCTAPPPGATSFSVEYLRARTCALLGIEMISDYLKAHNARATPQNVYCCWVLGQKGFSNRHFRVAECKSSLRKAAEGVNNLCTIENPPPPFPRHVRD